MTEFIYPIILNNLICFAISTICYNDDTYFSNASPRYPRNIDLRSLSITYGSNTKNAAFVIGI